jgi:hypothetical protein
VITFNRGLHKKTTTEFVKRQRLLHMSGTHTNVTGTVKTWRPSKADIGPRPLLTYRAARRNAARITRNKRV